MNIKSMMIKVSSFSGRTPLGGVLEHVTLREVSLNQNGTRGERKNQ